MVILAASASAGPRVAIIMDDLGFSQKSAREIAALPCALAASVIPLTVDATACASIITASGKLLMIHMPMSSRHKSEDVPEYAIMLHPGMTATVVEWCLDRAQASIPHAVALNNHEGSLATEDRDLMGKVMVSLLRRKLDFLDSETTEHTVAWEVAREMGLPWARNQYFLDEHPSTAGVEAEFTRMLDWARRHSVAIGIGHAWRPRTLEVLARRIPQAIKDGYEFVPITALMERPVSPAIP
jgi:polysaccharide deacetylase 2 family uncharacterized protein YibQ